MAPRKRGSTSLRVGAVLALLGGTFGGFLACGGASPAPEAASPPTAPSVPRAATALPAPPPAATTSVPVASAAPSASVSADPAPPLFPPRSAAGKVYCGTVECDLVREACCYGGGANHEGRCIPTGEQCKDSEQRRSCDEAADCPAKQLCCEAFSGEAPPVLRCSAGDWRGLCSDAWGTSPLGGEVCMPGSACRPGRTCGVAKPGNPGFCDGKGSVRCGKGTCSGEQPRCVFDPEHPALRKCAEDDRSGPGMTCTSPADCFGYPCLDFRGIDFRCGNPMDAGMNAEGALCVTVADCPLISHGSISMSQRPMGCRADKTLPPGVKRCVYTALPRP